MATDGEIEQLVRSAASHRFPGARVSRIRVRPDVDWSGDEIVRILVVFETAFSDQQNPDFLGFLTDTWSELERLGDERTPIINYATEHELAEHADPEP